MPIIYDEVSAGANSGTELMLRVLESRLNPSIFEPFSIGRAAMLFPKNSKRIYWTHNLPGQMNIPQVSENLLLKNPDTRWDRIDQIVFVSEWQRNQYIEKFQFTKSDIARTIVLRNAITPIEEHEKPLNKIRLIYMSVPERGLLMLYHAFNTLAQKYDIELDVFSSYQIYGASQMDIVHRQTLDLVRSHPKINYYGSVPNSRIREALKKTHIFAYPATFLETSCISLIEAMSAQCHCVHPDLGALKETGNGYTDVYDFIKNKGEHLSQFTGRLEKAINDYSGQNWYAAQKECIDNLYSWENRVPEWKNYLETLNEN